MQHTSTDSDELHPFLPQEEHPTICIADHLLPEPGHYEFIITEYEELKPEVKPLLVDGIKNEFSFYDQSLNQLEFELYAANAVEKPDPIDKKDFERFAQITELLTTTDGDVKPSVPIAAPTTTSIRGNQTKVPTPKPTKSLLRCHNCPSQFRHNGNLRRHQQIVHSDVLVSESNSEQPQVYNDKGFVCPECDRTFRTNSTLQQHRVIHSDKRPYGCEVCGRAFNRISTLIAHRRTHQPDKPFCCHLCPKAFHQKGNLRNHIFMHTNARPYRCGQCDKGFNQLSNLNVHRLKSHGSSVPTKGGKVAVASTMSSQCQRCGDLFANFEQMRSHEVRVHRSQLVPMKTIDLTDDADDEEPASIVLLQPKAERTDPQIVPLKTVTITTSEAAESYGAMSKLAMPKVVAHEHSQQGRQMNDNLKTTLLRASLPNTIVIERKPNVSIGRTMTLPKSAMLRTSLPPKLVVPAQKDMVSVSLKTINLAENPMAGSSRQQMPPVQQAPMAKLVTLNTVKKEQLIQLRHSTNLPNITVSPLLTGGAGVPQRMPLSRPVIQQRANLPVIQQRANQPVIQQRANQPVGSIPSPVSRPQNPIAAQLSPSLPTSANTTFIVTTDPNIVSMQFIMPAIRTEAMYKVLADSQIPYVRLFLLSNGTAPTMGLARISEHSDPRCHQLRYVPFDQLRNGNGRVLVPVVADLRELNAIPTTTGKVMRTFLVMPPRNDMRLPAQTQPVAASGGVQPRVIMKTMPQLEPTATLRQGSAATPGVSIQIVRSDTRQMPQSAPPQLPHVATAFVAGAGAVSTAKRQRRQQTVAGASARPAKVIKTQRKSGDSLVPPTKQPQPAPTVSYFSPLVPPTQQQQPLPTVSYVSPLLMAHAPTAAIFENDVRSAVTVSEHEYRSLADNRNDDISLAISNFATGQLLSPPRHRDDATVGIEPMDVVPPMPPAIADFDYENLAISLSRLRGQYELDAAQQEAMHLMAETLKIEGYEPDYDNIATCIALHYY